MNIEIRRLAPELLDDYLRFFDQTPHSTNQDEHKCYCVCWSNENDTHRDFSTAEKRRALAMELVAEGHVQGYLAYSDGQVVGWCNANTKSECYECISWRMFMGAVPREEDASHDETGPARRIKSVFCFAIAPQMRGKGIAGALLRRVCEDAERDGFVAVEAYPNKAFIDTEQDFMGPAALFGKNGFVVSAELDERLVMRKALHPVASDIGMMIGGIS